MELPAGLGTCPPGRARKGLNQAGDPHAFLLGTGVGPGEDARGPADARPLWPAAASEGRAWVSCWLGARALPEAAGVGSGPPGARAPRVVGSRSPGLLGGTRAGRWPRPGFSDGRGSRQAPRAVGGRARGLWDGVTRLAHPAATGLTLPIGPPSQPTPSPGHSGPSPCDSDSSGASTPAAPPAADGPPGPAAPPAAFVPV